jgi:opacity protein-like surface antigen
MKKTFLLLLTLFIQLHTLPLFAQLELGFQGGKNFLEGDAHCWKDSKITPFTATGGTFGVFARYLFDDRRFGARLNYAYMPLKFDERKFASAYHSARGFNGTNKASDISLDLAWHLLRKKQLHPYVFGGVGVQLANYQVDFNDAKATAAMKPAIAQDKAAKTTNFILPVGAGLEWRINPRVGLHWENSMRLPISDMYDGISKAAFSDKNDWYGYSVLGVNFLLQGEPDSDKDGVPDKKDACPKVKGLKALGGCPDTDGDGIKDSEDRCPTVAGLTQFKGCPDSDGDNVPNIDDECPTIKGSISLKGCPDRDDDGVADRDDDCPDVKGVAFLRGCPDSDGDNVTDKDDMCPNEKGTAAMKGCPDSDGDGISDKDDKCPNEKGTATTQGCPEVKPVAPVEEVVKTTTTNPTSTTSTQTVVTTPITTTTSQNSSSCAACTSSNDPIFTSVCVNPKKLTYLGSNPEFGNSHALTPEGFYNKLSKAYKANEVDRVFLDRVYKAMGYSGFADAKPEHFSEVVIPKGTSGKLGYSKQHKTGCYTLPDAEYHRMAFRIEAANGCHLHFMKTCGNHFFYCN